MGRKGKQKLFPYFPLIFLERYFYTYLNSEMHMVSISQHFIQILRIKHKILETIQNRKWYTELIPLNVI